MTTGRMHCPAGVAGFVARAALIANACFGAGASVSSAAPAAIAAAARGGFEQAAPNAWVVTDEGVAHVREVMGLSDVRIERIEIVNNAQSGRATAEVSFGGEARTLVMHKHSLRSDTYQTLVDAGNGVAPAPGLDEVTTYRGYVEDDQTGLAVVSSIYEGQMRASVHAPDRSVWRIEPVSTHVPGADANLYAIYLDSDVLPMDVTCGTDHALHVDEGPELAGGEVGFGDRGPACIKQSEVVIDTDYEYFSAFLGHQNALGAMTADIELLLNECDFVFQRDFQVALKLNTIVARTTVDDPWSSATLINTILGEFRTAYSTISFSTMPRDYHHLFSGRDFDGGTIGLAYVGVICSQTHGAGVSQVFFSSTLSRRALLVAHEMGHQWDAPHDNQAGSECEAMPSTFIMNPSLGSQALQFSSCSIGRMTTHRDERTCLSTPSQAPIVRADFGFSPRNVAATVDVLRNDVSNCGPIVLALPSTTTPAGATLAIVAGGTYGDNVLRYIPPFNWTGTETIQYTATNLAGSSTGTVTVTIEAPRVPENPTGTQPALRVKYYDLEPGTDFLPNFDAMTPYLETTVGAISFGSTTNNFSTSQRADYVGAVYTGYVNVPNTGVYTFFTESSDGSRLWIGNRIVVSNDGVHGMQERSGQIYLSAGRHEFRVDFFEAIDSAGLFVRFQGPGVNKQVIPNSAYSHVPPPPPCVADFNDDGSINATDIFAFLDAWFAQSAAADMNNSGAVEASDIFFFLDRWFANC